MAVTPAGFAGLRIALTALARPHYLPAREVTSPITAAAPFDESATRGTWTLGEGIRDASGTMVADGVTAGCPPDGPPDAPRCGSQFGEGAYNWALYYPADRFWLFQGIETGIFVGLAALLVYLAVRRIRRIA